MHMCEVQITIQGQKLYLLDPFACQDNDESEMENIETIVFDGDHDKALQFCSIKLIAFSLI